jgi:hypothetical protein
VGVHVCKGFPVVMLKRVNLWVMVATFAIAGGVMIHSQSSSDTIEHRVTVVETKLDSLEGIGRALLIMVGGSLLLQGLNLRPRRNENAAAS